jgi:hypothetical protein
MKLITLTTFLLLFGLVFGISVETRADLAKPKVSPTASTAIDPNKIQLAKQYPSGLTIETDSKAYEARLQLSEKDLRQLQAALAGLPAERSSTQAITRDSTRTIIAGVSMFMALAFGGVWLVRSSAGKTQRTLALLIIGGAVVSAAAIIANANGVAPAYRWRALAQNLAAGRPTTGMVMIEVVPGDSGIKLVIPIAPPKQSE